MSTRPATAIVHDSVSSERAGSDRHATGCWAIASRYTLIIQSYMARCVGSVRVLQFSVRENRR